MPNMRAVLIKDGKGPIENLYIGEIEKPTPGNGEVLVQVGIADIAHFSTNTFTDTFLRQLQVKAFGLNRMDISQRNGNYPPPPGAPDTLGVEFSGIITELGEGAGKRWKVGDEVIGLAGGVSPLFIV